MLKNTLKSSTGKGTDFDENGIKKIDNLVDGNNPAEVADGNVDGDDVIPEMEAVIVNDAEDVIGEVKNDEKDKSKSEEVEYDIEVQIEKNNEGG